jgi:mannonate dehydratase
MNRRDFLAAPLLVIEREGFNQAAARSAPERSQPALMKVGTQHGDSDQILRAMAGFGVNHICSRLPSVRLDDKWSVDSLSRFREHVESFGITLDMMPLPMSSNDISRFELPNIMLGKSPIATER